MRDAMLKLPDSLRPPSPALKKVHAPGGLWTSSWKPGDYGGRIKMPNPAADTVLTEKVRQVFEDKTTGAKNISAVRAVPGETIRNLERMAKSEELRWKGSAEKYGGAFGGLLLAGEALVYAMTPGAQIPLNLPKTLSEQKKHEVR